MTVRLPNDPGPYMASVPIGWEAIVARLVADLDRLVPGWTLAQAKEKFGASEFYVRVPDDTPGSTRDEVRRLVGQAREASMTVCDICAQAGRVVGAGWLRTRCSEHENFRWQEMDDDARSIAFTYPEADGG